MTNTIVLHMNIHKELSKFTVRVEDLVRSMGIMTFITPHIDETQKLFAKFLIKFS